MAAKLKKGDTVVVLTGKDKGKKGEISALMAGLDLEMPHELGNSDVAITRAVEAGDRHLGGGRPRRDLFQERVVVAGDDGAGVGGAAVETDAHAGGAAVGGDAAVVGDEVVLRVLGGDAALDGVAVQDHVGLGRGADRVVGGALVVVELEVVLLWQPAMVDAIATLPVSRPAPTNINPLRRSMELLRDGDRSKGNSARPARRLEADAGPRLHART